MASPHFTVRPAGGHRKVTLAPGSIRLDALVRDLKLTVGIPEDLVDGLSKAVLKENAKRRTTPARGQGTVNQRAVSRLEELARQVPMLHYLYYRGLLDTVEKFLKEPGIPANGGTGGQLSLSKSFPLRLRRVQGGSEALRFAGENKVIHVQQEWKALSPFTVLVKKQGSKFSFNYWRHTGALSRAYGQHKRQQLQGLGIASFIGTARVNKTPLKGSFKQGQGQNFKKVQVLMTVGVPAWDTVMDAVITEPLAYGRKPRLGGLIRHGDEVLAHAKRRGGQAGEAGFVDLAAPGVDQQLRGIYKLVSPELNRPILRELAKQANQSLLADIKKIKGFFK